MVKFPQDQIGQISNQLSTIWIQELQSSLENSFSQFVRLMNETLQELTIWSFLIVM